MVHALASYLQSMERWTAAMPPRGAQGRARHLEPLNLLKNLNLFGWLAVLAAVLVLAAVVFLVWRPAFIAGAATAAGGGRRLPALPG